MSALSRQKSKERSAYLKEHRITRETGMCPWGCGTPIRNGGQHLLNHLTFCRGKRRVRH